MIFRLRSLMDTVALHHGGKRVMIVAHQVVVLCLRYVIEGLSEEEILAIDKAGDVANCSVTEYALRPGGTAGDGGLALVRYNAVEAVEESAAPVTAAPDAAGRRAWVMIELDAAWLRGASRCPRSAATRARTGAGGVLIVGRRRRACRARCG